LNEVIIIIIRGFYIEEGRKYVYREQLGGGSSVQSSWVWWLHTCTTIIYVYIICYIIYIYIEVYTSTCRLVIVIIIQWTGRAVYIYIYICVYVYVESVVLYDRHLYTQEDPARSRSPFFRGYRKIIITATTHHRAWVYNIVISIIGPGYHSQMKIYNNIMSEVRIYVYNIILYKQTDRFECA